MVAYRGRRDFRSGSAIVIICVVVTFIFATGAVMTYHQGGWSWVSIGLVAGAVFSVAAIVEALIFRVQLTDDALLVTDLRGRRRYSKSDITGVEQGKGIPTFIILANGRAVALPPVGSSIGNSIRAWIRHSA